MSIAGFLDKFLALDNERRNNKTLLIESAQKEGILLIEREIVFKEGYVIVDVTGPKKSELFIKKGAILERFNSLAVNKLKGIK